MRRHPPPNLVPPSSSSSSSGGTKQAGWKRLSTSTSLLPARYRARTHHFEGQRSWFWLWLVSCRRHNRHADGGVGGGSGDDDSGSAGAGGSGGSSSVVSLAARSSSAPSTSSSFSVSSSSSSSVEVGVEVASGGGGPVNDRNRIRRSWVGRVGVGITTRLSLLASSRSRPESSMFGDRERDEWEQQQDREDRTWFKRLPSVVVMGWRKGYAAITDDEGEDLRQEEKVKAWWNIFLVGVGSISNLYIPVGDLNELDLSSGPLPSRTGLAVMLEEGIELAEL